MNDLKPWYVSRTIWASIVSLVIGAMGVLGMAVDGADQSILTDATMQAVVAVAGAIAIWGRITARDRIG